MPEASVVHRFAAGGHLAPVGGVLCDDVDRVYLRVLPFQKFEKVVAVVPGVNAPFGNYPKILEGFAAPEEKPGCLSSQHHKKNVDVNEQSFDFIHIFHCSLSFFIID